MNADKYERRFLMPAGADHNNGLSLKKDLDFKFLKLLRMIIFLFSIEIPLHTFYE
jgi:hypothetical protein